MELYSPEEWDQVWRESNGRLCGVLSGESAPVPRSRRTVLVGALLTAISPLMAQSGRIRIRVIDQTGVVVSGALVALLGADGKPRRIVATNEIGEASFMNLPLGAHRFTASSFGYRTRRLAVTAYSDKEMKIETILEVATMGYFAIVRPSNPQ
jgi:hypothetical protein